MHKHPVHRLEPRRPKSVSHGFRAFTAAFAKNDGFLGEVFRHLFDPGILGTHHHIDAGDALNRSERLNRSREHRAAAERHVLFRAIEPHSGADARRTDESKDGGFGRRHDEVVQGVR